MRIIDKNHDIYDYLQDPTDNHLIFDRRGSFLLDKTRICKAMQMHEFRGHPNCDHKYLEVQCGPSHWVFLATITERDTWSNFDTPVDYDLELIKSWRDDKIADKPIRVIVYACNWDKFDWKTKKMVYERQDDNILLKDGIDVSTYTTSIRDKNAPHGYRDIKYTIPLLKGIGIGDLINPFDIFCAIEEHFSMQKTAAERTEPIGATNNDKIVMHGFDTKTSFRGR